jgi:hypothetical protein
MATYRLTVHYAYDTEFEHPQVHAGLTRDQVEKYVRPEVGFMHDLLTLEGRGITRMTVEIEKEG